jgi:hypothetical protein
MFADELQKRDLKSVYLFRGLFFIALPSSSLPTVGKVELL